MIKLQNDQGINNKDMKHCKNKIKKNKTGILIVNLGTPDSPTTKGIKVYLKEFLSDERVIEANKFIWQIILRLFILPFRSPKVAKSYASIWDRDKNESPLLVNTRNQAEKMQAKLGIPTYFAMRYGNPSIDSVIQKMNDDGIKEILVIPLYPQYSSATTATVVDKVNECLGKMRRQPTIRYARPYFQNKKYIEALNNSINNHLQDIDFKPEKIILSYHGIPRRYHKKGDPYPCHCKKTSRLLTEISPLNKDIFITTFQSIFGKQEWVKPYTNATLIKLGKSGVKNISIIAPAFASDCLETLEEICEELKDDFINAGGENFSYIPCLNDSDESIDMLCDIAKNELKGWI